MKQTQQISHKKNMASSLGRITDETISRVSEEKNPGPSRGNIQEGASREGVLGKG